MKRAAEILRQVLAWTLQYPLGRSQWIALVLWTLLLAGGTISLGDRIASTTNLDAEKFDQGAYLRVAEQNRPQLWPAATDGIRNPLFPWLLAKTASGDPTAMFAAGKKLNVRCAALLLLLLGAWAGRRLSWLTAMAFVTLATGILLPISTYVGTEILFYGLFFAAWLQAIALLDRITWPRCALFGATLGLAYLAKPGVTLLVGSLALVSLVRWIRAWRQGEPADWRGFRPLLGAGLALLVFVPIIVPRAQEAWRQFGDPLQNTATQCFWEDNWSACYPKLSLLNPRQIDKLPPEERPSAGRYFARNGFAGAWTRLTQGIAGQAQNVFCLDQKSLWFERSPNAKRPVRRIFPYRGFFLLLPAILTLIFTVAAWRRFRKEAFPPVAWFQAVFALLVVGISFGAYSWYWVIAPGARFILALYLPALASSLLASEALRRRLATAWSDRLAGGCWLLLLATLTIHFAIIATHPVFAELKDSF